MAAKTAAIRIFLAIFVSTVVIQRVQTQITGLGEDDRFLDLINPNDEIYRLIYKEAINGQLQQVEPQAQPQQFSTAQMFLDLFQRNNQSSLDLACASNPVQIPTTTLNTIGTFASKNTFFFSLNPMHLAAMNRMSNLLLTQPTQMDTLCMARAIRDRPEVNRHAWVRAVMAATMRRPDLNGLPRPNLAEITPSLFINNPTIQQAFKLPNGQRQPGTTGTCALVDGSVGAEANGVENRLWYFREDIMVNSHHWFWHLANPFSFERLEVPPAPRPNRRGELFYYFHHSVLARYHSERLSNGLPPVRPLAIQQGGVIPEQYYAFLTDANSARSWSDRPPNTPFQDIVSNRDFVNHPSNISITERLENLRRVEEAIQQGVYRNSTAGQMYILDSYTGIDVLAEMIEASIYSPDPDYYGEFGLHNDGHFIIGLVEDALDLLRIPPAVMADGAAAMRDPVFYTYHQPINDVFESFKETLQPYYPVGGEFQLLWPGIQIGYVQVQMDSSGLAGEQQQANLLQTYWNYATVDLVRGLDFNRTSENGSVIVCVQHLDHRPFNYQIQVNNGISGGTNTAATASVRIFLAPRYDLNGRRYTFNEQRKLFFALDYFQVQLQPGQNVINRHSSESTLTIEWPQTFEELERDSGDRLTPYCGCGWPRHLLLPKGTTTGLLFDLFVMLTNAQEDLALPQQASAAQSSPNNGPACRPAPIYCGIMGQPYPDTKPMGYPFDRLPYSVQDPRATRTNGARPVELLEEYMVSIPNMRSTQVLIQHNT